MQLTPYVEDLQRRLAVAAEVGGEDARQLAQRLTAPLDAAVRLVLLEALSAAAGVISAELAPGSVDVRLRDGEPEFVVAAATVVAEPPVATAAPPTMPPVGLSDADAGSATRTTLRLPDHLKTQVELAAARDGISVNAWLVRAVAGALGQPSGRPAPPTRPDQRGATRVQGWMR
jgi:hypothetical protein